MEKTLSEKINAVLSDVSPMLGLHGGNVELVGITDGVAQLRFLGACVGCMAAEYTLEYGLKELLLMQIEELEDVVAVNNEPKTHLAPTHA